MRTIGTLLCFVTLLAFMMACGGDTDGEHVDAVYLYTPALTVESAAGECSVTLASTRPWTAVSAARWINVRPSVGAAGFTAVTIGYDANASGAARTDSVVFVAGAYSEVFKLTQTE